MRKLGDDMCTVIAVTLGEESWADLNAPEAVVSFLRVLRIAAFKAGTAQDYATVAIRMDLPDGQSAVVHMPLEGLMAAVAYAHNNACGCSATSAEQQAPKPAPSTSKLN